MGLIDGIFNWYSLCLTGKTLEEHGTPAKEEPEEGITDEELLTYSLLSGNKQAEKFLLWKIWNK